MFGYRFYRVCPTFHRYQRAAIVSTSILVVFASLYARLQYIERREQDLAGAFLCAGGEVDFGPSIAERIEGWWRDEVVYGSGTSVVLSPQIDDVWIREHDYLRDLRINSLWIEGAPVTGPVLARVLATHHVAELASATDFDELAIDALCQNDRLKTLFVDGSDLNDAGLSRLPLEQLQRLGISMTHVTPEGMFELRRCHNLEVLCLDRTQLNKDIAEVLATLSNLESVLLYGSDVTSEHLRMLRAVKSLRHVQLPRTARISKGDMQQFRAVRPGCTITRGCW